MQNLKIKFYNLEFEKNVRGTVTQFPNQGMNSLQNVFFNN